MSASGNRRSWEYPVCPECDTDVLVEYAAGGAEDHHCLACGALFTPGGATVT